MSANDRERLRVASRRRRIEPAQSLFGPASVTWRVNRETVLLLGGGRALLMQLAHPLIAAGVAEHSNFRREPLQRLRQTLELTLTIAFGTAAQAIQAVRAIERVHARVRGRLAADVGPFPRGTRYDANDPALLFWVHATLVDSALVVYERFVERLSPALCRRYYEESKITARLFGIPERFIPETLPGLRDYLRHMIHGNTLTVGPAAREVAAAVLAPPLPVGLKQAFQLTNLFTIGLLPPALRKRYGFSWDGRRQWLLESIRATTGTLLPFAPEILRAFPHARRRAAAAGR